MKKQTTVFFDVIIFIITLSSLQLTWMLLQDNLVIYNAAGNYTQTSVITRIPGSNLNYAFPIVLIIAGLLNARSARYKMALVALAGLVSMVYNQVA